MMIKTATLALVLTAAIPPADARVTELRVTGIHVPAAGDTPDSARRLALADARRKALQAMVESLQQRADIQALRLKPAHLQAYTAPIVDIQETGDASTTPGSIDAVARFDAADAAGRIAGFRKDQDISYELLEAWTRAQHLQEQLATLARRRAAATGNVAAGILQEQLRLVDALDVNQVIARGYAALARTEPTTVGGRAIATAGLKQARQLSDAAVMRWPESPDAHYLRGDVLVESGEPEASEAEYRKALVGGASSTGRTKLATALRYQGKFDEAIIELHEARRLDPSYARARADLGMILGSQGKTPEAIAAYREAIRLDPDSTDAHNGLAVVLAKSGKMEDAVAEFREIIRVDPDSTIGYYNLAYALAELDRDVESAAALREVIRINPNHYNARFNLGELFRLEGKYDDSATQFREYLRLAPDTPQSQRNITRAKGYIRQFEDPDAPPVADTMMPPPRRPR